MKKQLGELVVAIEKSGRGFAGSLSYEGGNSSLEDHQRVIATIKGKTEDAVMAAATQWLAKRTPKKILIACARCRNGVELEKKLLKRGLMEIQCNACGAIVYRGAPIEWPQ